MEKLNTESIRSILIYTADKIIENKPLLTETDSKIGDGDHGIGMERGMQAAKERLQQMDSCTNAYDLFYETGKSMLTSMGGASGVIFGTLFMAGAKGKPSSPELGLQELTALFEEGLCKIRERGKASAGDKTMVDALEPAVFAMKTCHTGIAEALESAALAAEKGVEETKNYVAKFGRAKSLMERSIGYEDAGAVSTWIIFRSMAEFLKGTAD